MQLAVAGHQFEHSATIAESCDICVQLDRLDDSVAEPSAALEVLLPAGRAEDSSAVIPVKTLVAAPCNARAPPVI